MANNWRASAVQQLHFHPGRRRFAVVQDAVVIGVEPNTVTQAVRRGGDRDRFAVVVVGADGRVACLVAAIGRTKQNAFWDGFRGRRIDLRDVDERTRGRCVYRCRHRDGVGTCARRQRARADRTRTHDFNSSAGLRRTRPVSACCAHSGQASWQFVFDDNGRLGGCRAEVGRYQAVNDVASTGCIRTGARNRLGDGQINTLYETEVNRHVAGGIQTTVGWAIACRRTTYEIRFVRRFNEKRTERYNVTRYRGRSIGGTVVVAVEVAVRCCA